MTMKQFLKQTRKRAQRLSRQAMQLAFALSHPRVKLPVKLMIIFTLAYVLSPIDLIPDFIPVIGLLDDIIIVPICLWLILRLIPQDVSLELKAQTDEIPPHLQALGLWGAGIITVLWLVLCIAVWRLLN